MMLPGRKEIGSATGGSSLAIRIFRRLLCPLVSRGGGINQRDRCSCRFVGVVIRDIGNGVY